MFLELLEIILTTGDQQSKTKPLHVVARHSEQANPDIYQGGTSK